MKPNSSQAQSNPQPSQTPNQNSNGANTSTAEQAATMQKLEHWNAKLEKTLQDAEQAAGENYAVQSFCGKLMDEWRQMHQLLVKIPVASVEPAIRKLDDEGGSILYMRDTVLRCILADQLLPSFDGKWPRGTMIHYHKNARLYDKALGALIPSWYKSWSQGVRYKLEESLTSAEEWSVYQEALSNRRRNDNELLGLTTGLSSLDRALGGLRGLTFLGGDKGVGKTTLALSMALAALKKHPEVSVLFYSLDMGKGTIYDRILCHEAGIEFQQLLRSDRTAEEDKGIENASAAMVEGILARLRVIGVLKDNTEKLDLTTEMMEDHCKKLRECTETEQVLVVIDLFRNIDCSASKSDLETDYQRLEVLTDFRTATSSADLPTGYPVLVISEVRKGEPGRSELWLDDLFGAGQIGYKADTALLLWQRPGADPSSPNVPMTLRIAKGRDGVTRTDIPLIFHHTKSQFTDESQPLVQPSQTIKAKKGSKAKALAGKSGDD
jgi:replicative DNA helicase